MSMPIRNFILGLLGLIAAPTAIADSGKASIGNADVSAKNLSQVVSGSEKLLKHSAQLTITAIKTVGNVAHLTLKAAKISSTVTVTLATKSLETSGLAVGKALTVIPKGAGSLLMSSGKAIAFIPNELGKALIFSFPRD